MQASLRTIVSCLVLAVLLLLTSVAAAENSIELGCDRNDLSTADVLQCQVVLTITDSDNMGDVRMPEFKGFEILNQNTSSQHSTTIINFKMESKQTRTTTFMLRPVKAGEFSLGPASFRHDGRIVKSGLWHVRINQLEARKDGQYWGDLALSAPLSAREKNDPRLFVRLIPEKHEVYAGESMTATLYGYISGYKVSDAKEESRPAFEGFRAQALDLPENRASKRVRIGSETYTVMPLVRFILTGKQAGARTISPYRVSIGVNTQDFFNRVQYVSRSSDPLNVLIKNLPEEGKPQGFRAGQVGSFELKAKIDRRVTEVNQPVALTIELKGGGDYGAYNLPSLPPIEGVKSYPPSKSDQQFQQGVMMVNIKKAEYLLVPQSPGQFLIPSMSFSYFDTKSGIYETATTRSYAIRVSPGSGKASGQSAAMLAGRQELLPDGEKLRPIKIVPTLDTAKNGEFISGLAFKLLLFVPLAILLLLMLWDVMRWIKPRMAVGERVRLERQVRELEKSLQAQLEQAGAEFYSSLAILLYKRLELASGASLAGMTHDQLSSRLSADGWDREKITTLIKILETCEMGRYALSSIGVDQRKSLLDQAASIGGKR